MQSTSGLRRIVILIALLNLGYFGIEFAVALAIGSVSLFADSVDFLEDASVNLLIAVSIGLPRRWRARVGMFLSLLLLVPGLATLWAAWDKLNMPLAPPPAPLAATGLGALCINLCCAFMLAHYRDHAGSITRAAFLSARNDAIANLAIICAGAITAFVWSAAWPDLIVGMLIGAINIDAAREVWSAAMAEHTEEMAGRA